MAGNVDRLVFASYNTKDREKAEEVAKSLESWGIELWFDKKLNPGALWGTALEDVLEQAEAAVVFCGAEVGRWQRQEILLLHRRYVEGRLKLLIPVLIEGARGDLQGFLGLYQHVDYRGGSHRALPSLAKSLLSWFRGESSPSGAPAGPALFELVISEAVDPAELEDYVGLYIKASKWREALYVCSRLRTVALSRFDGALFAKSCEWIGNIYFSSGQRDLAEIQWSIARSVYAKYAPAETEVFEESLLRLRSASYQ
jgi:hypothetical protein